MLSASTTIPIILHLCQPPSCISTSTLYFLTSIVHHHCTTNICMSWVSSMLFTTYLDILPLSSQITPFSQQSCTRTSNLYALNILAPLYLFGAFSPLYFSLSIILLHPSCLHSDIFASLGYYHSTLSRLVSLYLSLLRFSCTWLSPSDHLFPLRYYQSVSSLLNYYWYNLS